MLMDALGIAIAFTTVMLLLSIIVTAMVQMTLALLRTRARNLLLGIATLIREARSDDDDCDARGYLTVETDKQQSARVLNSSEAGTLAPVADPTSFLHYTLLGPKVSWLEADSLLNAAQDVKIRLGDEETVRRRYALLESAMRKRFLLRARLWSLAWAAVVAIAFQVSTPELLQRIATDAEYRDRIVAESASVLIEAEENLARLHDYEGAAEAALERLAREFPDAADRIEEASGIGVNKAYIVRELEYTLDGHPRAEEIVARYRTYLDDYAAEQLQASRAIATDATRSLALLDIAFWPRPTFYYSAELGINAAHVVGVAMSTILLMLGAPFWFNVLQRLVNLRDALSRRGTNESRSQAGGDAP